MIYDIDVLKLYVNKAYMGEIDIPRFEDSFNYRFPLKRNLEQQLSHDLVFDRAQIIGSRRNTGDGFILTLDCGLGIGLQSEIYSHKWTSFLNDMRVRDAGDLLEKNVNVCMSTIDGKKFTILGVATHYDASDFEKYKNSVFVKHKILKRTSNIPIISSVAPYL